MVEPVNRAAKGARVERKVAAHLRSLGFEVTRSAASRGAFDLVGWSSEVVVLVQVRANQWPGRAETARLRRFGAPAAVRRLQARWDDYATTPRGRIVT